MSFNDNEKDDSFDKLLMALERSGFKLPYSRLPKENWQLNRSALISAMTDSEWIAQ